MKKTWFQGLVYLLLPLCQLLSQSIIQYEYFFDADPGIGKGNMINTVSGETIETLSDVDISALQPGFHRLGIRYKDAAGKWSHTEFFPFFIDTPTETSGEKIEDAEYFFDTDPGVGNGLPLALESGNPVITVSDADIAALAPGFHRVGLRYKKTANTWSHADFQEIWKEPASELPEPVITMVEYSIGTTDNGVGTGNLRVIQAPADRVDIVADTMLNNLPLGNYLVHLRVKDTLGRWSHRETRNLTVCSNYGPESEFTWQTEGNRVYFTNNAQFADSVSWSFGNNTANSLKNPIINYAQAGIYPIRMITVNNCGADTLIKTLQLNGLQRLNANRAGNGGIATITFNGFGFQANTGIKLEKDGQTLIPFKTILNSSQQMTGYFDLRDKPTGLYHGIADLDSPFDTLVNAFTVETSIKPSLSVFVSNNTVTRPGRILRVVNVQNQGNEDAIMVPITSEIGFVPGEPIFSPDYHTLADMVFMPNKGIFQQTYQYLQENSITEDVMRFETVDTLRKKKLVSMMKIRLPAYTRRTDLSYITTLPLPTITVTHGLMVHPPYFSSDIVQGNATSTSRDCMNSFLKKAVRKNVAVNINDQAWDVCFNEVYDTLTRTIRQLADNPDLQAQAVPTKAIFSTLLAGMAQCNAGVPAKLSSDQFKKIVTDVTFNWFFYEDLDSLGKPCFDTLIAFRNNTTPKAKKTFDPLEIGLQEFDPECPGAMFAPELAEECEIFTKPCKMLDDTKLTNDFVSVLIEAASDFGSKLTGLAGNFCSANSASAFCEKLCLLGSLDPNDKTGPGNNDTEKYVNHFLDAPFTIRFENLETAGAPAAYVEIRDTIDLTRFDIHSFQAGALGWADSVVTVEANRQNLSLLKDLRPAHPNFLRMDLTLDTLTGIAIWKLWTLDTTFLQLTSDPTQGFLPPNKDGKEGSGFVSFSIKPRKGLTSGAILQNSATIIFDENEPLGTGTWEYRIDTTRPVSAVLPLPPVQTDTAFLVTWAGNDAHAGIRYYNVYFIENDSILRAWRSLTPATSDTFRGRYGSTYKFFSVAVDRAGNFEEPPADPINLPDAITTLSDPLPVQLLRFYARRSADRKRAEIEWATSYEYNVLRFDVERAGNGSGFEKIASIVANNSVNGAAYSLYDEKPQRGVNLYRLKMVDRDGSTKLSPVQSVRFDQEGKISVYPTITVGFVFIQADQKVVADLFTSTGLRLSTHSFNQNGMIDLGPYPDGLYFIKFQGSPEVFKVMKR